MLFLILYIIMGVFAGLVSGLLGIGGGVIVVPSLLVFFKFQSLGPAEAMQAAIATSLAMMMLTSLSSAFTHHYHGHLKLNIFFRTLPTLILGVILGVLIAQHLSYEILMKFFIVLIIVMAFRLWFPTKQSHRSAPPLYQQKIVYTGIGILAGSLGIGGGVLTFPYLLRCQLTASEAVALSALTSFAAAVIGTLSWNILGVLGLSHSLGSVHWDIVWIAGPVGIITAFFGARLSKQVPLVGLKRGFALLLIAMALQKILWN